MTASVSRLQGGKSKAEAFSRRGRREERKDVLSSRLGSWRLEISVLLSFLGGGQGPGPTFRRLAPPAACSLGIVKQIAWWGPGPG